MTGGEGTQTSSGAIKISTPNSGVGGASGMLAFSSGSAKGGNTGAILDRDRSCDRGTRRQSD